MLRCVLILAAVCSLAASEPQSRFALADLTAAAHEIQHLRVTFRQIKDLELFDQPVVTAGVLEISRPLSSVRWEFTGRSVLVLRNDRLQRWNARGERETIRGGPASQALMGQMNAMLTGDWRTLDKLFTITLDPSGEPKVHLRPRDEEMTRYVTEIRIAFQDDLSAPRELIISAPGGDLTRYEFDVPERPTDLAAARFAGP
ncbi:MAG: outer membrane lipoprotein carrier protein LolA [Planctomycetota bacterium]|nr:outer membrane lipoprotein carrier protein LolA [Planctomycetota bacterium]